MNSDPAAATTAHAASRTPGMPANAAARVSHRAYADGNAERCTACAASVTGSASQPGTWASASKNLVAA